MIVLAFVAFALFVAEAVGGSHPWLVLARRVIRACFLVEFTVAFLPAPLKPTYLWKNWPKVLALVAPALRLLRIFRILKLTRYVHESGMLGEALWRSRRKVLVFPSVILALIVIFGAAMYVIEGPERGFTSIPTSMYWAVVTVATVGFGDIAPGTPPGGSGRQC